MDTQFNVISSTFNVLEDALIQKINYDQRLSNRNQFDEIEFNFFLNKKHIRKKGVFYNNNTLDTFSIIPVLQYLSSSSFKLLKADLSVQHMATKVPVLIQKDITSDLTPFLSQYTVPSKLLNHLKNTSQSYIIYTLKVTSWQGLIYNKRHYYVYLSSFPYTYVGHWGGVDETNLFSWVLNN